MMIKILLSYYLIIKKKWVKNQENLNNFIDVNIMVIFLFLMYNGYVGFNISLFLFGMIFILLFLLYKMIWKIGKEQENFIKYFEKKEKIKSWLLKPSTCKRIYYLVWMLPWNIGYWIYFWVMENGWYFRVWFCSNRDIFFKKYFGWDSRDFFFNLNKKMNLMFEKIYVLKIKKRIIEVIGRIQIILYLIRGYIQNIDVKKYIFLRLIVYMYLSIFYLFFFLIILNYYLLLLVFFIEFILLVFFNEIVLKIEKRFIIEEKNYYELKNSGIITQEFIDVRKLLNFPMYIDTRLKWEENVFIWDKTLSNSVTLNMLYKYMIWVNKNTEGYFDFKMNMRSRIHRKKFLEEKSIIWDVLPRTRYVIVNLKYFGYETPKYVENGVIVTEEYKFTNLIENKNFYLSYYEKAYCNTSLTLLVWILRKHTFYWLSRESMDSRHLSKEITEFYSSRKTINEIDFFDSLIYLYTNDKRFFKLSMMLISLFNRHDLYCCEELFFHYYKWYMVENAKNVEIPSEFFGMKDYKMIFKIMGRIHINEEEVFVWNLNLQQMLQKKEELFKEEYLTIINNDKITKEEKLKYRYNKFFFEDFHKDIGVLEKDLEQKFKINYKNYSQIAKLEPDLMEYYNMHFESFFYWTGMHISMWKSLPFFDIEWSTWDQRPKEFRLFVFYCIILKSYHYDLIEKNKKDENIDSDGIADLYDI